MEANVSSCLFRNPLLLYLFVSLQPLFNANSASFRPTKREEGEERREKQLRKEKEERERKIGMDQKYDCLLKLNTENIFVVLAMF